MDDGQFFDDQRDARDAELDGALDLLKSIPQSTVAFEVGISERRLRDIERGRSKPRPRTREAILRLADGLRSNAERDPRGSNLSNASENVLPPSSGVDYVPTDGQLSPLWAILVVVLLLCGFVALIYFTSSKAEE